MTLRDKVKRVARKGKELLQERAAPTPAAPTPAAPKPAAPKPAAPKPAAPESPTPIFTTTSTRKPESAPPEAAPTDPKPVPTTEAPPQAEAAPGEHHGEALRPPIIEALHHVYDPELPVNIYDLRMVYDIRILPEDRVEIDMTLTSPGCPMAGSIVEDVRRSVDAIAGVGGTTVNLVWDPPWSPDVLTDDVRLELGLF